MIFLRLMLEDESNRLNHAKPYYAHWQIFDTKIQGHSTDVCWELKADKWYYFYLNLYRLFNVNKVYFDLVFFTIFYVTKIAFIFTLQSIYSFILRYMWWRPIHIWKDYRTLFTNCTTSTINIRSRISRNHDSMYKFMCGWGCWLSCFYYWLCWTKMF